MIVHMSPQSKYFVTSALSLALLMAPFASFAAGTTTTKVRGFCSRVDTVTQNVDGRVAAIAVKVGGKESTRQNQLSTNRANRDESSKTNRVKRAANRSTQYQKLESLATTSTEKAAVAQFEATINAAITTRENAIDAAIAAYRTGVDNVVNTKFSTLNSEVTTLQQNIVYAGTTAKNACATGQSSAAVRTVYISAVKAAHTAFKGDRDINAVKTQIKTLESTRKQAVQAALNQFKTTAEAARTTLKAAFGK